MEDPEQITDADERDAAMGFSEKQLKELNADLDRSNVKERDGLSYIEGWHAIAEANRIFGFDKWDRETVYLQQVDEGVTEKKNTPYVCYIAKVRITVRCGFDSLSREGTGYGTGYGSDKHEGASKEAETDAMKRALMTFGNPFGLALYDKEQEHVSGERTNGYRKKKVSDHHKSIVAEIFETADKLWGKDSSKQELSKLCKGRMVVDLTDKKKVDLLNHLKSLMGEVSEPA